MRKEQTTLTVDVSLSGIRNRFQKSYLLDLDRCTEELRDYTHKQNLEELVLAILKSGIFFGSHISDLHVQKELIDVREHLFYNPDSLKNF